MKNAVIVDVVRTPMGKAKYGSLSDVRPDEIAYFAIKGLFERYPMVDKNEIGDVILGCAFPELEQGMNAARTIAVRSGIPNRVPAITVNRYCSSGLQAISYGIDSVRLGYSDIVIAGGFESMSYIPLGGKKMCPNPELMKSYPEYYLNVGMTAEKVAELYEVTREMQDELAFRSFKNAERASNEGRFKDEIVPVFKEINGETKIIDKDDLKQNVTLEKVKNAKTAFMMGGTVTGSNSSQTTDGASVALIMSEEKADELGLKPMARLLAYAAEGCEPDLMGLGPMYAIPKALKMVDMEIEDIDLFEINEAFSAQAVACINELNIDPMKVNVNGGAIALGHPTGCTGARLTSTLLYEMKKQNLKYGVVSMCVGAGMGAAGVFEMV
ncbi:3-ketoacyl-CoA thiolase [Dethiosulfatibacter aminovorans DSM 17477]|uniref:acetyl-CoA C-acyltransferase n=1 Tax=Dethiosulfatibacter aminovorans DSM 17477 TaxID=1121476 RepID=A0A1M6MBD2_9FIRM|nr:thiolase family protein [Dethiosulfatibacter aminovorans]SHJ80766.1 3-ketoacyl-CoA thiolase [Dethiosulfatibacter aminovorans DSM 17477]